MGPDTAWAVAVACCSTRYMIPPNAENSLLSGSKACFSTCKYSEIVMILAPSPHYLVYLGWYAAASHHMQLSHTIFIHTRVHIDAPRVAGSGGVNKEAHPDP